MSRFPLKISNDAGPSDDNLPRHTELAICGKQTKKYFLYRSFFLFSGKKMLDVSHVANTANYFTTNKCVFGKLGKTCTLTGSTNIGVSKLYLLRTYLYRQL